MKTLTNLTLINLKQNRSRTVMTIIGVALSVALILSCIGFATSVYYSEREDAVIRFGEYHIMYKDIPGDKISIIEESSYFKVRFYSEPVGCVVSEYGFEDCEGLSPYSVKDYTAINDANELVRDADHKYNVFTFYSDPSNAEFAEKRMRSALQEAGVEEVHTIKNGLVAWADGDVPETTSILIFWLEVGFILCMSIIAAFVIRNSFNISITERTRQFGMLASIGARPKQIRAMVYLEGLFISLVAIPIGILLGCAATLGVVAITNALVGFSEATNMLFYIPPHMIGIIALVGFFIVYLSASSPAIVASRVSPIAALRNVQDVKVKAKKLKTSKLTQNMFGIGGVIAAKNLKRSRSKYRTTVISIVLSVAVYIGISAFMMYGYKVVELAIEDTGANAMVFSEHEEVYADIIEKFNIKEYAMYYKIDAEPVEDDGFYAGPVIRIVSRDEFARYAKKTGAKGDDYANMAILLDTAQGRDNNGNLEYERTTDYKVGDEIKFRAFGYVYDENAVVKCDPNDMYSDVDPADMGEEELEEMYKCASGELDKKGSYVEAETEPQTLKITHIADKLPLGVSRYDFSYKGLLFISEDSEVAKNTKYLIVNKDYLYIADKGVGKQIETYLTDPFTLLKYHNQFKDESIAVATDLEEAMKNFRNTILLFEIIIYGFIVVAALVGITNIFNTITTNVALRAKEFAVLKSIGMTEGEFNRMIRLECIMYTVRSLLIGIPVGLLISYGVFKLFSEAGVAFGWLIPWGSIGVCVIVVTALIALIMYYSVRKIKKQNIIETIRKESF